MYTKQESENRNDHMGLHHFLRKLNSSRGQPITIQNVFLIIQTTCFVSLLLHPPIPIVEKFTCVLCVCRRRDVVFE